MYTCFKKILKFSNIASKERIINYHNSEELITYLGLYFFLKPSAFRKTWVTKEMKSVKTHNSWSWEKEAEWERRLPGSQDRSWGELCALSLMPSERTRRQEPSGKLLPGNWTVTCGSASQPQLCPLQLTLRGLELCHRKPTDEGKQEHVVP